MTDLANDSSTNIDNVARDFCEALAVACAAPNNEAFAKWSASNSVGNPDSLGLLDTRRVIGAAPIRTFRYGMPAFHRVRANLTFVVSPNRSSAFRTPAEQAREVARSPARSWACWGAHMSDKARHVLPHIDGVAFTDGDDFEVALGKHLSWFIALWKQGLRNFDLRDAAGQQNWFKKDQLHVELPNSKITQSEARAGACVDEYVRLIKLGHIVDEGKQLATSRNHDFELKLVPHLRLKLNGITESPVAAN